MQRPRQASHPRGVQLLSCCRLAPPQLRRQYLILLALQLGFRAVCSACIACGLTHVLHLIRHGSQHNIFESRSHHDSSASLEQLAELTSAACSPR